MIAGDKLEVRSVSKVEIVSENGIRVTEVGMKLENLRLFEPSVIYDF